MRPDYADLFTIDGPESGTRSARQLAERALEHAAWPVRSAIWFAHRHLLRFRLGPRSSPDHVLGWTVVADEPDMIELEAESTLLRAVVVMRRVEATWTFTTQLFYARRAQAPALWTVVGPLHRRIAPYLLKGAVASDGPDMRLPNSAHAAQP